MEGLLILIFVAWLILFILVFPIWVIVTIRREERRSEDAIARLEELERKLARYEAPAAPNQAPAEAAELRPTISPEPAPVQPAMSATAPQRPRATPPPLPPAPPQVDATPPPEPPPRPMPPPPPAPKPPINWERFMGVNLFAWVGGFALFLAVAFFVKYSIDNNLISPQARVALGFLTGAGLLIAGLRTSPEKYRVTSHTLCATSIVILYADVFAAHSFYHFIGRPVAFLMMALVTAAAILIAIRLEARLVAVLGLLGGFLTPQLLPSAEENVPALFGYAAFLDAGLVVVALRKRWPFLVILAALGTVFTQVDWAVRYFEVARLYAALGVFLSFQALFLAAFTAAKKRRQESPAITAAAIILPAVTLVFLFHLLFLPELAQRPLLLFLFALGSDLCLMALAYLRSNLLPAHRMAGIAVFFLLAVWTSNSLTANLLYHGLTLYLVFTILHTFFPVLLHKIRPDTPLSGWDQAFAPFALVLALIPVLRLTEISTAFWFAILLIDAAAMIMAFFAASLFSMAAALIITVVTILAWLLRMPEVPVVPGEFLLVTGGFAAVFFTVGIVAGRRIAARKANQGLDATGQRDAMAQIPALSAVLPFLLLDLAVIRLPLVSPSPLFALALFLVVLLLGLSLMLEMDTLAMVGLLCTVSLEFCWHHARFQPAGAGVTLAWYLAFYGIFTCFPFVFRSRLKERVLPWATAAVSAPLHFYLVYRLTEAAYPNAYMGLLPAAFSIPSFAGLWQRLRSLAADSPARNSQLAWFGGVSLFFVTLVFPVQFERQWILIGWALEGVALLWLFHRIPHTGLKIVGFALLVISFAGLVNPGFFLKHARSELRIFNWYLYTYGIVTASLMAGARLLAAPRNRLGPLPAQALLYGLGTLLAFLLMNIEIADYYSEGPFLAFQFSGNFARDMAYSIAWACFALGLLVAGIRKGIAAARYGSLLLLGITLLKLFFHDLARLKQLYRVGALVGVAVILILASYLYQRFVSPEDSGAPEGQ